jgi:hypothetical protein
LKTSAKLQQVLRSWRRRGSAGKGNTVALPPFKSASAPAQQSRLILQDPLANLEEQVPTLRLSRELGPSSESGLDRDAAQQIWETLQLKPEEIIANRAQLKEANAKLQVATQRAQTARAEVVQLQAKVQDLQDTRWQHPAVYGAGVALLGVGWLWLSERKKRIVAQEQTALLLPSPAGPGATPQDAMPLAQPNELPLATSPSPAPAPTVAAISDPIALSITQDDLLPYVAPEKAAPPLFEAPSPWWKRRKSKPAEGSGLSSGLNSTSNYHSTQIENYDDSLEAFDGSTELEDMQAPDVPMYEIELANAEMLSQPRLKPASPEDAMGHLLEIRMAVQSLTLMGNPLAALKLLLQHIDEVPNTCAWAYMEYLDLSSTLGQRDAFEAMRKRYRLQFNRLAPYWMEPNGSVQSLDSYDRPMAELCAVWPSLERTKVLIATWLLGTLHSRRLFQRPAYHDLLDLYAMLEFYDDQSPAASDFVPTVSLLDLDYEFAVEVKIEPQSDEDVLRAVPTVKTGDFDVDYNLAQGATEMGALLPIPDTPKSAQPR